MTTTTLGTAVSGPPPVATRHDHQRVIVTSIERPGPELVAACRSLYTGLVLDHLGKHGCMAPDMKSVWSGAFLCGSAVTCLGADWRIRSMAADLAHPGDVIVLAAGALTERACFGDMTATCWKSKGIEGVVIDGAARDVARLRNLAFPVFARGVTPRNFHYPAGPDHGAVNVPVVCAGVLVEPGDLVSATTTASSSCRVGSLLRSSRRPVPISRARTPDAPCSANSTSRLAYEASWRSAAISSSEYGLDPSTAGDAAVTSGLSV